MSETDHLEELTKLGWYRKRDRWEPRKQEAFTEEGQTPEIDVRTDPVARQLQRTVGVYNYRSKENPDEWEAGRWSTDGAEWLMNHESHPRLFFGSQLSSSLSPEDEGERPGGWPTSREEMEEYLTRLIPIFRERTYPFYNYSKANWCDAMQITHLPESRLFADAFLHAEVWGSESHPESVWVFVALWPGQRVPDWHIEEMVHDKVKHMLEEESLTPEERRQREEQKASSAMFERLQDLLFTGDDAFDEEVEEYGREEFWEEFGEWFDDEGGSSE